MSSQSGAQKTNRYSMVRYWRYIFTPLLIGIVLFGLYLLFTSPDAYVTSYNSLVDVTRMKELIPSATGSDILRQMQSLRLGTTSAQ